MKTKSKIAVGIAILLVLGGITFFAFSFLHQPPAGKSLDDLGLSISKRQLADVGYGTPEAALETHTWAMANTNYDKMLESITPEIRAIKEKDTSNREHFGLGFPSVEKLHILAEKKIRDDVVELKVATEQRQKDFTVAICIIEQMTKIANEWKWAGSRTFDPAWDKDSQPESHLK